MKKYIFLFLISVCAFFAQAQNAPKGQANAVPKGASTGSVGSSSVIDTAKPKGKGELIKPIKVWKNGASLDAESLDLTIVYDDLESSAKVYYSLKDSTGSQLADGNLDISGADYRTWNTAPNRINWAYNFTIRALRLQQRNQQVN
jgi:hypothetical protein